MGQSIVSIILNVATVIRIISTIFHSISLGHNLFITWYFRIIVRHIGAKLEHF
jgi:hypothetical protein